MADLTLLCRTATTFGKDGKLDEKAFRKFLQRFVDARLGVYLASAGSGEGHALTKQELKRVYEIGVEVGKGKIQVNANPPEQHTARAIREQNQIAIDAGVDVVNVYGPASWHGFRPTDDEYFAYYDAVLKGVKTPIAIAPNPVIGYTPSPSKIAEVCNRHKVVQAINLSGVNEAYFIELKEVMKRRDVEIYTPFADSIHTLAMGATGLVSMEANILPKSIRRYLDLYKKKDIVGMNKIYADMYKFNRYVRKWHSSTPRWLKMTMQTLRLPGWEGGLREPYRLPGAAEMKSFSAGLLKLGIPEIDAQAKAAGVR